MNQDQTTSKRKPDELMKLSDAEIKEIWLLSQTLARHFEFEFLGYSAIPDPLGGHCWNFHLLSHYISSYF